jgi:hypothetical protein
MINFDELRERAFQKKATLALKNKRTEASQHLYTWTAFVQPSFRPIYLVGVMSERIAYPKETVINHSIFAYATSFQKGNLVITKFGSDWIDPVARSLEHLDELPQFERGMAFDGVGYEFQVERENHLVTIKFVNPESEELIALGEAFYQLATEISPAHWEKYLVTPLHSIIV